MSAWERMKFSLAPMAGYTDAVFRRICAELGADFAVSEMISAAALVHRDRKTGALGKILPGEAPVVLQVFGHEADELSSAARMLLTGDYPGCSYAAPPAGIEVNMGCPVKKIVNSGDGCALMRDIPNACRIVSAMREVCEAFGVPLSVKFRLGWNGASVNAPEFAVAVAKSGAQRITVHCRTREQLYAPSADPAFAGKVVQALAEEGFASLSVYGNGDVESPESAERYTEVGCAGAAIGRAALGNPWIFRQLHDPESFIPPTTEEILSLVIRLVEESVREKGEAVGVRESRSRAAYFIRGMRGSAKLRDELNHSEGLGEFIRKIEEYRKLL